MLDRSIRAKAAPAFLSLMTALIASNLSLASPAAAQPAAIAGSGEGRYFDYQCGPGLVLVGLSGSAGILIDNIQAVCGRLTVEGDVVDVGPRGPIFGGARPQDKQVTCPADFAPGSAVIYMNETYPHVGSIVLHCVELANRAHGGTASVEFRGGGNLQGYEHDPGGIAVGGQERGSGAHSFCAGQYAVGIRGRAGNHLSAFGLFCGTPVSIDGRTLGKRKKPAVELDRRRDTSATTSIPQTQRTLGKRKRPAPAGGEPTGGAASEAAPQSNDPYTKGGPSIFTDSAPQPPPSEGGLSINSDSQLPPPSAEAPPPPAPEISPLIAGDYSTRIVIRESRCIVPVNGSWQSMIALEGRSVLVIPIQQFNNLFAGPLVLQVNGTGLTQTASVSLAIPGGTANYPAQVTGGFDPDFQRFEVRFEVDAPLCSFDGHITGAKP